MIYNVFGVVGILIFLYFIILEVKSSKISKYKKCKGVILDARVTDYNELGDNHKKDKAYLYYQYNISNILHGGSSFSCVNNAKSRLSFEAIVRKFNGSPIDTEIFYDPSDPRKSFLFNPQGTSYNLLYLTLFSFVMAFIFYLRGW